MAKFNQASHTVNPWEAVPALDLPGAADTLRMLYVDVSIREINTSADMSALYKHKTTRSRGRRVPHTFTLETALNPPRQWRSWQIQWRYVGLYLHTCRSWLIIQVMAWTDYSRPACPSTAPLSASDESSLLSA